MMVVGTFLDVSVNDFYKYSFNSFYLFSDCSIIT